MLIKAKSLIDLDSLKNKERINKGGLGSSPKVWPILLQTDKTQELLPWGGIRPKVLIPQQRGTWECRHPIQSIQGRAISDIFSPLFYSDAYHRNCSFTDIYRNDSLKRLKSKT